MDTKLEKGIGRISYERVDNTESGHRLTLELSRDFGNYYFFLIPKYKGLIRPRYAPHITIIRIEKDIIPQELAETANLAQWAGRRVEFWYEPVVKSGDIFYWLDCYSTEFEAIRDTVNLPNELYNLANPLPPGFRKRFHTSIAKVPHE